MKGASPKSLGPLYARRTAPKTLATSSPVCKLISGKPVTASVGEGLFVAYAASRSFPPPPEESASIVVLYALVAEAFALCCEFASLGGAPG
eukprot:1156371-Pelagomonas_calceolata.AAC.4